MTTTANVYLATTRLRCEYQLRKAFTTLEPKWACSIATSLLLNHELPCQSKLGSAIMIGQICDPSDTKLRHRLICALSYNEIRVGLSYSKGCPCRCTSVPIRSRSSCALKNLPEILIQVIDIIQWLHDGAIFRTDRACTWQ